MNDDVLFLRVEDVVELHREGLNKWGGRDGVRSPSELASAVGMAEQTYDGQYLHENLFEMAAAYAFHISQNQAFIEGNKRAGVAAALVFLEINGIAYGPNVDWQLYSALIDVAEHKMTKSKLARLFSELPRVISVRDVLAPR
jgi:death-on-curing protein